VQLGTASASYGEECATKDHPGIYTNILHYSDLIYGFIGNLTDDTGGGGDDDDDSSAGCDDLAGWSDMFGGDCDWITENDEPGCPAYGSTTGTGGVAAEEACCYCSTSNCDDLPGWVDFFGDDCSFYEENDQPGCPTYGDSASLDGVTAMEACCYCKDVPAVTTSAPTPSPSASPSAMPVVSSGGETTTPSVSPSASPSASPSSGPTPTPVASSVGETTTPSASPSAMPVVSSGGETTTPAPVTSAPVVVVTPTATVAETAAPVASSAPLIATRSSVSVFVGPVIAALFSLAFVLY